MSYSKKIARLNASADPQLLGVQLGQQCIAHGIPVIRVCRELDVSKAAVYRWFTGKHEVNKHLRPKVTAYYRSTFSSSQTAPAPCPNLNS